MKRNRYKTRTSIWKYIKDPDAAKGKSSNAKGKDGKDKGTGGDGAKEDQDEQLGPGKETSNYENVVS